MTRKSVGHAQTDAEKDLEAAVLAVSDWTGKEISYQPVGGGISNSNWRVFVDGFETTFFVKIPGKGTEMFIERGAANEASKKAYEAGVGAKVHYFDPDTGVEIFEFVDGLITSTNGDFLDRTVRLNAVHALRAFNQSGALGLQKTLFDAIDEHFEQILNLGGHFPEDFSWLNSQYRDARAALEASGLDMVPCMNDTLAGNFLLDADKNVMLVDFEYASNNDVCAELAIWFGEMFFPEELENEAIEEYFGRVEPRIVSRITLFKALADLKWSSWAMVQNKASVLDFDYFKYGVWKHMRARNVMRDPRWGEWLKAV